MRQIRADELLYELFAAMRGWTATLRNGLATNDIQRHRLSVSLCGTVLADKFRRYLVFPDGEPAPLNQVELVALLTQWIGDWPRSLHKSFASREDLVRQQARKAAAALLAERFAEYQLLSDAPEPPPYRMDGGSGVPAVDETVIPSPM